MFTVEEVAEELRVSKVTIYAKLKKFNDKVVVKQGKKYITEDLVNLIKQELTVKNIENNNLNDNSNGDDNNKDIRIDTDDLINLNKDLIKTLIEQLNQKDKQISELHKLIENSQVLIKDKGHDPLLLEEQFQNLESKIENIKENMQQRNIIKTKESFWNRFKAK
ncbi:MAG: hypothetical protein RSD36_16255 [Terrisporobacter sp.]